MVREMTRQGFVLFMGRFISFWGGGLGFGLGSELGFGFGFELGFVLSWGLGLGLGLVQVIVIIG